MAAQVFVIGPAARRHVVKVTPGTYLNDVLQEACSKFHLDASQYGLKNNSKNVDLSRTFRLSGLISGAKLELVVLSRSPAPVNIALELPESEANGLPGGGRRLTEKFASNTTIWTILRHFESNTSGPSRNFTTRGVAKTNSGESGAGRVFYETPVVQIMGRELSTLTELQKTLGQLGLTGSALLRLTFKVTDIPLEDAMEQTKDFFKPSATSSPEKQIPTTASDQSAQNATTSKMDETPRAETSHAEQSSSSTADTGKLQADQITSDPTGNVLQPLTSPSTPPLPAPTTIQVNQRNISIFAAPTSTTPQAAQMKHNEADYVPSIAHAQLHQSRLLTESRNKRLQSDAEIAAQEAEEARKRAQVKVVDIKLKFPDEVSAIVQFTAEDSAEDLYNYVKGLLDESKQDQPFTLSYPTPKGSKPIPKQSGGTKLIASLGLVGRVMVTFVWDEGVSTETRLGSVLKGSVQQQAQQLRVVDPVVQDTGPEETVRVRKTDKDDGDGKEKGKGGVPKWFKGLAKK